MDKNDENKGKRRVIPERMREFQYNAELDRLYYLEFEKNIIAIENHELYMEKSLEFIFSFGVPNCNILSLGGQIFTIHDLICRALQFNKTTEQYESCSRILACEAMPEYIPWETCFIMFPLLKQFYLDSTMMMSYEESMIKVQQKMIDTTEFFGLSRPHDYVKVVDRVIEFHKDKLDFEEMQLLEYVRQETIELHGMEKKDFELGKDRKFYFYIRPEEKEAE